MFATRQELIDHAKGVARNRNISLSIDQSKHAKGNRRGYANIICDFGGQVRHNKIDDSRRSSSKKIGCPFMLHAREQPDGYWELTVSHGTHNHDFPTYGEGQRMGKLTQSEYLDVCESSMSGLGGNATLTKLRRENPNNVSTQRHIQNALIKYRNEVREGRSPLQQFFKLLGDNNYRVFMRRAEKKDQIGKFVRNCYLVPATSI